jgi:uncharacterized OB-fold protein
MPTITPETEPYWRALKQRKLLVQRCAGCGYLRLPARWICPECLSEEHAWEEMSGAGRVETFVWYLRHIEPVPDGIRRDLPYNVAVVQLAEGPRLLSNVEGTQFGELQVGDAVTASFEDISDDWAALRFVPATERDDSIGGQDGAS